MWAGAARARAGRGRGRGAGGEGLAADCLASRRLRWSCLPNTTSYITANKTLLLRGSAAFLPSRWEVLTTTLDSLPRRQEVPAAPLPDVCRAFTSPGARPPARPPRGARGSCGGAGCLPPGASLLAPPEPADSNSRYRGLNMQCKCTRVSAIYHT